MSEPRQIAVVRSEDDLLEVCRAQAAALAVTYGTLDRYCDFTEQFWSKKLAVSAYSINGKRGAKRGWSAEAFQAALVAFCFDLVAVENPEKIAKLRAFMARNLERPAAACSMLNGVKHPPIIIRLSRRHMKKLGKISGRTRTQTIAPEVRSRVASQAAKARWHKPKVVEIGGALLAAELSALPQSNSSGITRGANKKKGPQQPAPRSEARTVRRR